MTLNRRMALAFAALTLAGAAQAQDPQRITLIVPYPPGGLSDQLARLTGKVLGENMKVPVIVENKPGANGVLGLQAIAAAKPDGTTIGLVPASVMTVNPALYKTMKVDTVKDITPLTLAITLPNVLVVHPSVPAKNMEELVAWMHKEKGKVSYGSMGTGSSAHLNGELLSRSTKVDITHVPYKGSGPAMQGLMAGDIQMAFENLPVALPMIQSGKLRAIGVTSTAASTRPPTSRRSARACPASRTTSGSASSRRPACPRRAAEAARGAGEGDQVGRGVRQHGSSAAQRSPPAPRTRCARW
ncbi:tripartite tricarboxylate transporter substrate binding protein [Ramlibacter terrae]|uniref:Tripartite tricarboxylate transporter substrate binding protein n=1 Tax=Ramlibacter terrae TaxID=2732511 RepID=A0ABX6P255_9BURK|nr:tripartite tricarboxylate transporter substrate binding protein [Ramlibacter terrae]